ncbi:TadE/TadG family type IV pilus assembly protein [Cupriavidus sp. PET2-C1]
MPTYARAMKPLHRRGASSMSGAAGVEFALVFPLLLLVVFGTIEFGTALYDRAIITNASREAARAGVMLQTTPMTTSAIRTVALNYSQNNLVNFGTATTPTVTVTNLDGNTNTGSRLQVLVSYTFNGLLLGPLLAPLNGPLQINAASIMKYE